MILLCVSAGLTLIDGSLSKWIMTTIVTHTQINKAVAGRPAGNLFEFGVYPHESWIRFFWELNYHHFASLAWASVQVIYMVGRNRLSVHPLALVGRYSKLGPGSVVRFRSSPFCSTKCVSPGTDQISR